MLLPPHFPRWYFIYTHDVLLLLLLFICSNTAVQTLHNEIIKDGRTASPPVHREALLEATSSDSEGSPSPS